MISGQVNEGLEAVVLLTLVDERGDRHEFEAVVDTGFSGSLTPPSLLITAIGLPWRSRASVILANGDEELCEVYDGLLLWDGQPRPILIEEAETDPLLGMGLLRDYELRLEAVPGGAVTIAPIP